MIFFLKDSFHRSAFLNSYIWQAKVTHMKTATSAAVSEHRVIVWRILLAARGDITSLLDTRTAIRENTPVNNYNVALKYKTKSYCCLRWRIYQEWLINWIILRMISLEEPSRALEALIYAQYCYYTYIFSKKDFFMLPKAPTYVCQVQSMC